MNTWLKRLTVAIVLVFGFAHCAMANDYYTHGSFPTPASPATSAAMRAELDLITAGFDKLPTITGNAGKAVIVNGGATALGLTTGTLTLAGNFAISGAFATTLTVTAGTNVTLPTTGTLATIAGTETLTNKTLTSPALNTATLTSPTVSTGALALNSGQITFPASANVTGAANILDDYEEGTWTPIIGGSATYTAQVGTYTKIGNTVFITCRLVINVIGTGSQTLISGLPFTASGVSSGAVYFSGLATAVTSLVAIPANGTDIAFQTLTAAATSSGGGSLIFTSGTEVNFSLFYRTTS